MSLSPWGELIFSFGFQDEKVEEFAAEIRQCPDFYLCQELKSHLFLAHPTVYDSTVVIGSILCEKNVGANLQNYSKGM